MAFNQGIYNQIIAMGGSDASARNAAKASRPGKAFQNFVSAFNAQKAAADALYQQNLLRDQMRAQQQALLAAANRPAPKANQSLKSRDYQPRFKTRGSKVESKRAVSKGTQQFTNPLSMGGGFGSTGSPNLG